MSSTLKVGCLWGPWYFVLQIFHKPIIIKSLSWIVNFLLGNWSRSLWILIILLQWGRRIYWHLSIFCLLNIICFINCILLVTCNIIVSQKFNCLLLCFDFIFVKLQLNFFFTNLLLLFLNFLLLLFEIIIKFVFVLLKISNFFTFNFILFPHFFYLLCQLVKYLFF
jgi:hypothetical protein